METFPSNKSHQGQKTASWTCQLVDNLWISMVFCPRVTKTKRIYALIRAHLSVQLKWRRRFWRISRVNHVLSLYIERNLNPVTSQISSNLDILEQLDPCKSFSQVSCVHKYRQPHLKLISYYQSLLPEPYRTFFASMGLTLWLNILNYLIQAYWTKQKEVRKDKYFRKK